ncbi:MAG TPA: DNA polymerase [Candidatus Babeliales bacterium]|nr:DNA polymerase [Candidatus Babeliales bacterium]
MKTKFLSPQKQKKSKKKIYGFDIETANDNKTFVCATLYYDDKNSWTFRDKEALIAFLKIKSRFGNAYIVATNAGFDFFGTFFGTEDIQHFKLLMRGSHLLSATTYIINGKFVKTLYMEKKTQACKKLTCIDTLNFAQLSVDEMGSILKIPKMEKPDFLGQIPTSDAEWQYLIDYNKRDAEISKKFFEFLIVGFEGIGATVKNTIASTAMSLFRTKYLKETYQVLPKSWLLDILQGYYGGRTEVFKRGRAENLNYYDVNSLYPYSMMNDFPDPNHMRITKKNDYSYIKNYEGMSHVDLFCPKMDIPLLPVRHEKKLIFPVGEFTGWYTHVELRKAIQLGYVIKKIHKTYYAKKTCRPFDHYVKDLYEKRKQYKKEGSIMEIVFKLLLNGLYGKFAQHFMDVDDLQYIDIPLDKLMQYKHIDRIGDFFRLKKDMEPSAFSQPLWSAYVTAYGRLILYDYIIKHDAYYCDTDSIITKDVIEEGKELGQMKLEYHIKECYLMRPKMYYMDVYDKKIAKIKGMPLKLLISTGKADTEQKIALHIDAKEFQKIVTNGATYKKFTKFKEALRRKKLPNELIEVYKELDLQDSKRAWGDEFSFETLQKSTPITL